MHAPVVDMPGRKRLTHARPLMVPCSRLLLAGLSALVPRGMLPICVRGDRMDVGEVSRAYVGKHTSPTHTDVSS